MSLFVQRMFYLAVAFLLLCGSAMGAVKKWEGDVSSDWNNANNWQGNVFPGAANDALIDPANYTHAPVISSNSSHSFKKLTIQNGGLLTVQADLNITDVLLVTGTNSRFDITAGTFSISSGNKDIQVYAGGTINHSGGTVSNTGVVDIQNSTYNLGGTGTLTVGGTLELTAASANTAFNMSGGTCTVPTSMTFIATNSISTTVAISGGTFTNSGATYFNNAETDLTYFNVSGGTVTLAGVVQDNTAGKIDITVSNTGSLKFQNNVTMEAGDVITQTGGTITFEGGNRTWTNAGMLNATGGTIVFNDATATVLTGAGTWNFYNVTINSGRTLTATAPTNINVAGNWTNSGGTFNEGTKRVTFNGTGTQTVTAETFYDLTINKTAATAISLSANVTASNSLTMTQGNIDAGAFKMTLGTSTANTGTMNYTAGSIIGNFERWIASTGTGFVFPVGTASTNRSATATFTNLTNGSLIAKFVASNPGSSGLPLSESSLSITSQFTEGYWDFTAANSLASTNYKMDLAGTGFTSYTLADHTRVLKRTNGASSWALQGTHVALSGSTASRSGLNGISTAQFGFGHIVCPTGSATVTQPTTTDVMQGATNNEIIRIAVNSSGATCTGSVTQFNFSTAGDPGCTAASSDISNAKVYYTGTSTTFSTSTLFGSLGSAPNGAFTINGSQSITSNTVYFWLAYDISSSATRNNVVDGQLVSFVLDGVTTTTLTTPNPSGSRTIKYERYAVASGGSWNATSTWSYISGGAAGASVPTANDDVVIPSGITVNVNSSGAVAKTVTVTGGGSRTLLNVTTGGSLTCDSVSINTTSKRAEIYVFNTGQLTVNNGYRIDHTNGTEDNIWALWVGNTATASIGGDIDIVNPSAFQGGVLLDGSSVTTVTGNINFSGGANNRAILSMGGTARLNIKGALSIASGKYGKLNNSDAAYTSVINFNGTSAQTLELTPSAANSNMWQYSNVWISNPAGVTLNANLTIGATYATIQRQLVVKSGGVLKSGGYSIQMLNATTSIFQVDNGATYYTTSTDAYGGMPFFGTNQNNGDVVLGAASTVNFAGASQTIPILSGVDGSSYGNVILSGSGTKTLGRPHHADFSGTGAWDIEGDLTVSNGVMLDVSATSFNITIAGSWTDQNAVSNAGFNKRSGTVTFDGTTAQTITPTASPLTFNNFTTNKSAGTLNIATGDVSVAGTLTLTSGNINTGSRKLTLGTSTVSVGTYARTSGTIIGKFERWIASTGTNIVFPVGTASYYRPDTVYFNQLTAGSMMVEFVPSNPGTSGLPLSESVISVDNIYTEGYWSHTAANSLASTNYNIRLSTTGFTSRAINGNTRIIKRANNASAWTLNGTHVNSTSTSVRRNALSGFSEFTLGSVSCSPAVSASINVTVHPCNNTTNGALTLSTTNATAPVSYLWSNGATTQNLSGLSTNYYTVTVTDANLCTATASASVGASGSMAVTHSTSYDTPTGAIDLTVGGGTAPYTYLWNDKDVTVTTQDRTGLANGWYKVTITDALGCKSVQSAMVAFMDTIRAGSYIVDMGVMPQTIANGLKPFGFVSDMIRNQHVPVNWVINPDKSLYGTDITVDGINYKGGPFIVKSENIDNTIDSRIAYWESRGVVGNYTLTDVIVPVYSVITGFTNLGVDEANEGIVAPYFTNAEVPTSIYYVGLPSTLGACDNAYVLPHADPTWADHNLLKSFVQDNGYVWVGCHAVSALEGIFQPGTPSNRMNFLSQTGLQCYSAGDCGSIAEVHGDPTTPYTINTALAAHPLMQFMDDLTPSTENGSEDWYIPVSTGGWNTGTYRAITTSDGSYGKEGVKLVFGNGYDDKDNGLVMYEAGHTSAGKGTIASQVAAQRTFFNFILHAGFDRRLIAEVTAPASMAEGATGALSLNVTSGGAPFTYEWTTNVDGSFSSPNSASTNFTLNKGNGRDYARVTVMVTDNCGRLYFETKTIYVLYAAGPITSYNNGYNISCHGGNDGTITVAGLGGTPPYSYNWSHGANTATVTNLTAGTYTVTITDAALTTFYDTITLTEPPLSVDASTISTGTISCYGDTTGGINLTPSGGLPPYSYSWSNGESTQDISGLSTGTYTVTVTDANGCYAAPTPLSIGPDSITVTPNVTDVTCPYSTNGSISVLATGGTGSMSYLWSTGGTASSVSSLSPGTYTVTVTDANGCTASISDAVAAASNIASNFFVIDVSVHGGSNGVINQTVSGGIAPYSYAWSHGPSSKDVTNLSAGTYTVTITDANGCTFTKSDVIEEPGVCPCTWLGTTSSNWNVAANWDCGYVPGDTCDVVIQAGPNTCTITAGSVSCKDLTINPGISFEISGTATLNVYGDFTNNGTLVRNNSVVKFTGSAEQNISGTSPIRFHDLHIANTSATGVVMADNIEVFNELRLIDGYLFTGTDTVKMTNAGAGKLNTFSGNSFIVGRIWRKISDAPKVKYEFPVGDAGMPSRFFRATIETHALDGVDGLTVWFDSLNRHDDMQMLESFFAPPANVDTYYNHTVPYMRITSGDTTYSTNYGAQTAVTGVMGTLSGEVLNSASTYVNEMFTMEKTGEVDGFIYTHMASEGVWHFEPNAQPVGGFYNMQLYTANFSGLSDNNFGVLKRPAGSNGAYWSGGGGTMKPFYGTGRAVSHGFAMRQYLTTFSEGGIGGGGGSGLPIELLEFGAYLNEDAVDLTWVTATETRNAFFTIEKSNGEVFQEVAMVPGAGNSSTTKYYSDTDLEPFKGTSYYRLKQTDFDGKFTYSDVVSVTYIPANPMDDENVLIIYPNPTTGDFSVKIKNAVEEVNLSLFDNGGKLILTESYAANEDDHVHQMRLENVPNGVYHLKANMGSDVQFTRKLMLLRGN